MSGKKKDRNEVSLADRSKAQREAKELMQAMAAHYRTPTMTFTGNFTGGIASSSEHEFSERPFAVGSLTGRRAFRVDKYGRLLASQLAVAWTPGENVARCLKQHMTTYSFSFAAFGYSEPDVAVEKPHDVASMDCTCGFYAYFDHQQNQYHKDGTVEALIEGYGVVTVGSRGFRASKARVQALVIPDRHSVVMALLRHNYPDVPVFSTEADALTEFPLTPPTPKYTPESDPEFWTRDTVS